MQEELKKSTKKSVPLAPEVPACLSSETDAELVDSQNQTALIPVAATGTVVPVSDDLPMTDAEFKRLDELETRLKGNWLEFAQDSTEIRESRLYRRTRDGGKQTWEEYCKRFFGQTKQYVDKTIRAAEVLRVLKTETKVSVLPNSIAQAAPLSGLKSDEMAKATEAAFKVAESEKRTVTAEDFKKAAENLKSPKRPKGEKKPQSSTRPEGAPQAASKADFPAEKTGSVGLHINTVSLVAPVGELFEELKLQPKRNLTNNGTVFTFDGSAKIEQRLLTSLATLLNATGPLDLRITLG